MRYSLILCSLLILSCSKGYDNHDLLLLTSYRAKDMCSCMFVQGRDEDYCRDWTKASPNLATLKVDVEKKIVHTEALQYWSASAHWVDARHGCVLDEH